MSSPQPQTPIPRLHEDHLRSYINQLQATHIPNASPYLMPIDGESQSSSGSMIPAAKELQVGLLQDDFLAKLSKDVLKSFAASEMRGRQKTESLASQVYRIQQRILEDANQIELHESPQRGILGTLQKSSHQSERDRRNTSAKPHKNKIPFVSPPSENHPIYAGEFDLRIKELQNNKSKPISSSSGDVTTNALNHEGKNATLFDLAATSKSDTMNNLVETLSLSKTILDTKDDIDIRKMLKDLYEDREILQRSIAKSTDATSARTVALKSQLTDNERLVQACLMALQQRSNALETQPTTSQYVQAYLSNSSPENRFRHSTKKKRAPPVTAAIRPSLASNQPCGERFIPEYVISTIRNPLIEEDNSVDARVSIPSSAPTPTPNDFYNRPSSAVFPILAQSRRLRNSAEQRPFGEGCAYLPTTSCKARYIDNEQKDDQDAEKVEYNGKVEIINDCEGPMFSNYTTAKIRHTNVLEMHKQIFSPYAMKAFSLGSNVIKLVCPDSLSLSQDNCRYIGHIVEPLLIVGKTVLDISRLHNLRERLAQSFFYQPDGLPISPAERNFVWVILCFILYNHPEAIFITRSGNILQAAQFILPFDLSLQPTHVLLEASIIAPSIPLRSYAIANVAIPYFNGKPALPRATRLEALSKYQRRVYFSIDRVRYCLNKTAHVVASHLRHTTDVLE